MPSNDHSTSHLTQRLFLHYLAITQSAKYHFFYSMRYDCLINIKRKHILFTFLTHWLTFHPFVHFSTACSKIAWNVGLLWEHRQEDAFFIHWQQYRQSSAPDQSRLYQSLLDFTNIHKLHLVDTLLHDSQTCWGSQIRTDGIYRCCFIHFNAYYTWSAFRK